MARKKNSDYSSIYEQIRCEKLDWTRAQATLELKCIDGNRLERIEKNRAAIRPEEVLVMAEVYDEPSLCNYYCSMQCPLGKDDRVPYLGQPDQDALPTIVLQMIASLNSASQMKDRLIEIAADGKVAADELDEFEAIRQQLDKIAPAIKSLELWAAKAIKKK